MSSLFSTPDTPDYTGAAAQQGQASKEVTNMQTWANRPTLKTPWGSQTWTPSAQTDPATGQPVTGWEGNISLNPEQQAALDSQNRVTAGRSSTAEGLLGQVASATKEPFNWAGMPKAPGSIEDAQKSAYERMAAMVEPGRTQQGQALNARLLASGLPENSEAWNRSQAGQQNNWTQENKSMLSQAGAEGRADVASQTGLRQQAIAEEAQRRGMSLNELNALLTGQQVNMPAGMGQAPNTTAGAATPANYLGAATAQGQNPGGTNWGSAIGGIGQVAGAAAMFSDRRLKRNVVPLGDGWYEFEYIWGGGKQVGVMAQELLATRPDLVHRHSSGYLMVNYAAL